MLATNSPARPASKPAGNVFRPLGWQVAPWLDKSPVMLLDGSAGGGKSALAAYKIDGFLRKYPGAMGLVVRKTRESLTNSTLLYFEKRILAGDKSVRHRRHLNRFEYANGSILAYGGMKDEDQRESLRSVGLDGGLDIVWMEEAHLFLISDFEELLTRMRGHAAPWRQIILTTNPDSDQHWIYKSLIQGGGASRHISRSVDNTYNPADYAETLGKLTGARLLRLRDGKWVGAEGAVYEDYRYETHVIDPFPIPKEWTRFLSIDFGYTNPFVCQWWALDGDGRMYLYREIYMSHRRVELHADDINRLCSGVPQSIWDELDDDQKEAARMNGERISYTVRDHDANGGATLKAAGIGSTPAEKTISVGIQKTQERFLDAGDGRARIFFFRDATVETDEKLADAKLPTSTVEELTAYMWAKGADGKPNKEEPLDLNNHGCDAMRYAVMSQFSAVVWDLTREAVKI
jgi:PBSX family phage terminase large subunit